MNKYLAIDSEIPTPLQPKWSDVDMCEFLDWRDEYFSPYQDKTQTTELDLGWHRNIQTNKFYRTTELLQLFIAHRSKQ